MKDAIIVQRYAQAFFDKAQAEVGTENAVDEFKKLRDLIRENPYLYEFLQNLQVSASQKQEVLERVLKDFSPAIRQAVLLLLEKKHIKVLPEICHYVYAHYAHNGAENALLKTSYILDADSILRIKERLENKLKKKLNLFIELDPCLLGGVQVTVGNTMIDGSVRKRLDDLREKLMTIRMS